MALGCKQRRVVVRKEAGGQRGKETGMRVDRKLTGESAVSWVQPARLSTNIQLSLDLRIAVGRMNDNPRCPITLLHWRCRSLVFLSRTAGYLFITRDCVSLR